MEKVGVVVGTMINGNVYGTGRSRIEVGRWNRDWSSSEGSPGYSRVSGWPGKRPGYSSG